MLKDPIPNHNTVAVLGLGASGIGACRLLRRLGKRVLARDGGKERAIDLAGVDVAFGSHDLGDATAVIVSPGLNPDWPENRAKAELAPLWDGSVEVWSEVRFAAAAFAGRWITVGGTDGKSTTAAMTHALLRVHEPTALLGGNSWTALSDVVCDAPENARVGVAEVSAFQLWKGQTMSPRTSILTNIALDHLDHYAGESDYVSAKERIFDAADFGTYGILYAEDERLCGLAKRLFDEQRGILAGYGLQRPPGTFWDARAFVDAGHLIVEDTNGRLRVPTSALQVPGTHNQKNALAALLAARSVFGQDLGVEAAIEGLATFTGLPHRLAFVRERDGVRYFNDSKATNVHAAVTGLGSFDCPLVAIVGGVDKQLDLAPLLDVLRARARHTIVIGDLRVRFGEEASASGVSHEAADSLEGAVALANAASSPGDAIVLAPGCSSFDMFRSFEHRGDAFEEIVRSL